VMPRYALPPTSKHARKPMLPSTPLKKALPSIARSGGEGFRTRMDAFAEMHFDMKTVEGKLQTVEANLNAVLARPVTLAHRGRKSVIVKDDTFRGKALLKDVHATYNRIQTEYTAEALDKMLGRRVEWRDSADRAEEELF
jgi:hypothetical protein